MDEEPYIEEASYSDHEIQEKIPLNCEEKRTNTFDAGNFCSPRISAKSILQLRNTMHGVQIMRTCLK